MRRRLFVLLIAVALVLLLASNANEKQLTPAQ